MHVSFHNRAEAGGVSDRGTIGKPDAAREALHSLVVVLASAAVMIGISWAAMLALTAEDGWLHQATQAAAAEINTQAMAAFND